MRHKSCPPGSSVAALLLAVRAFVRLKVTPFDPRASHRHLLWMRCAGCAVAIIFHRAPEHISINELMTVSEQDVRRALASRFSVQLVREIVRSVANLQRHAQSFRRRARAVHYLIRSGKTRSQAAYSRALWISRERARPVHWQVRPSQARRWRCCGQRHPRP